MSKPAYDLTIHRRAASELDRLDDGTADALRSVLVAASERPQPTGHRKVEQLEGFPELLRVRVGDARAVCRFDNPELRVLLVDDRAHVYDRLDVALGRAEA